MAKKIDKEFNALAGKIVNQGELNQIIDAVLAANKKAPPTGFRRALKTATSIVMIPVNIVLFPIRIVKTIANAVNLAKQAASHDPHAYVRKEKEAEALAAIVRNKNSSKSGGEAVEEAIGAANVYIDAQALLGATAVISPFSKKAAKAFAEALAQAPDYSDDLKSGKLVVLPRCKNL